MEIADLNLIGDFEAGIKCLQNPSLLSKLSLTNKVPQYLYSFWTCGALIIAAFATFTNIFNKLTLFIHHLRYKLLSTCHNTSPQQILYTDDDFDFDFSDDDSFDSDDDTPSSVADSDDDVDSDDNNNKRVHDVFRAEGSGCYFRDDQGQNGNLNDFTLRRRNRFSWSDFAAGKSVVQLWDSFGLGLDFENDDEESEIAIWDLDREVKLSSGRRCEAVGTAAESVVVTAEMDGENGGVGFGTYDSRVGVVRCPTICAAWRPRQLKVE